MFDPSRRAAPGPRYDQDSLSEAASALLDAIVTSPREYALRAALEDSGHSRDSLAECWLAGLVDVLESEPEGHLLPEGVWVTLTPLGAARLGVRIEEDESGRARWVGVESEGPTGYVARRMKRCERIGDVDAWLSEIVDKRRRERERAEQHARELLRQAEADDYLVDPRTGEPVSLWGVTVGKKTRRVGTAPRRRATA